MRIATTARIYPPQMDVVSRLRAAAEAGFEGAELNFEAERGLGLPIEGATARAITAECERARIAVASVYSRDQWSHPISSNDPQRRKRGVQTLRWLVEAAAELGTDAVLVIPGMVDTGLISPETREIVPYQRCHDRTRAALEEVLPAAEKAGVTLCLENVWSKFLMSPVEFRDFVDSFGSPSVRAYFDIGNALAHSLPEHWIRVLGERIARIHVKDLRADGYPINAVVNLFDGEVDWAAVVAELAAIGYDGWLTAEVLPAWRHFGEHFAPALAANMRLFADAVRAGTIG